MTDNPNIERESLNLVPRVFSPGEMVVCSDCGRSNPPNRAHCLYCASEINSQLAANDAITADLQNIEPWENGFNVIVISSESRGEHEIARLLSMEPAAVRSVLSSGRPLPIARLTGGSNAVRLAEKLSEYGLRCTIVADGDLGVDRPNIRLSSISVSENRIGFVDFNTSKIHSHNVSDIALVVSGSIRMARTDAFSKRGRTGDPIKGESQLSTDDMILDIYSASNVIGYRVQPTGFDFSCLGERKALLARENWARLVDWLTEICPKARLVNDYSSFRKDLDAVWPVEFKRETHGRKNTGFGKREFGTTISTSNLDQFNRFSRLEWHLNER